MRVCYRFQVRQLGVQMRHGAALCLQSVRLQRPRRLWRPLRRGRKRLQSVQCVLLIALVAHRYTEV